MKKTHPDELTENELKEIHDSYYKQDIVVKLSQSNIQGISGVLSYDIALNQYALDEGYHPVSCCKKDKSHEHNIKRNRELIKAVGGEEIPIPKNMIKSRDKKRDKIKQDTYMKH